jgi:hypothetical protein
VLQLTAVTGQLERGPGVQGVLGWQSEGFAKIMETGPRPVSMIIRTGIRYASNVESAVLGELRQCRYPERPAVIVDRLGDLLAGRIHYELESKLAVLPCCYGVDEQSFRFSSAKRDGVLGKEVT